MDEVSIPQIAEIFLHNKEEAENYLSQYGNTGKDKNNGVSLSYEHIAKADPLFLWFSAATIGSIQVGKVIDLGNNPILSHCESTNTLSLGFSYGNQEIHNNIVALYNTHKDYGIDGLKSLRQWDKQEFHISDNALKAFQNYSELQLQAKNYASESNLPINDSAVIKHVLAKKENIELLKDATKLLVQHEQVIVQPMYNKSYFDNAKTVGETLNDTSYLEKLYANIRELAGAKILDKYISTEGYDFTSYEQRMAYFDEVFDEYFNILAQEDGLERLTAQRETMIAALGMDFIAYGEHFQDADQLTMSIADSSNHNDLSENYALTWDDTTYQWRMLTDSDISTHLGGVWVSPDTYPEVMNVVEKFPLIENTFYYDTTSNQSYLFCSASFLPNLPPNYTWIALKTYFQPVVFLYENRGSIWVPIENITTSTIADTREANNSPNKLVLAEILDLFDDSLGRLIESLPIHKAQRIQSGDELNPTTPLAFSDVVASSIIPMSELISEMVRSEFC